jgi:lipopolysaccharide transport system permease protein
MTKAFETQAVDREACPMVVYASESRMRDPLTFFRLWLADLSASGPAARRFFERSLTNRYRLSSFGLAWAFAPSVLTAIVLIAGQRAHVIGTGGAEVPSGFYGVFGLAVAQTFIESLNSLRVLFTSHQHLLRRNNVAIEGLILAAFVEVLFGVLIRLIVLAVVFLLFGVWPRFETLPLAFIGLLGVVFLGGGLGLCLAPASSLRGDIDQAMHLVPWALFAITPVFLAPAVGSLLARAYALNPLAWLFDSIRTAAYGAPGSLVPAVLAPLVGTLLVMIGWFFCRFCRPYVVERYLV